MEENTSLLSGRRIETNSISSVSGGRKVKIAQGTILATITLERIAFYSLAGNLVLFLNKRPYEWESFNSMYALLYFFGISYLTSFLGGLLADSLLGRFKTILLSLLVYLIGYIFLPFLPGKIKTIDGKKEEFLPNICGRNNLTIQPQPHMSDESPFAEQCSGLIFGVLTLIAIGSGPFRSNIAPFGADQVRGEGQQASLTFFNWYYWCVNVGSLIALLVITYIQQHESFYWGYLSALVCLAVSAFVFLCGCCSYVYRPRSGSVLKNIFKVLCEACSVGKCCRRKQEIGSNEENAIEEPTTCLDYAKYRFGGSFQETTVNEVKTVLKIICVFLTLIPYWMVYFQMETTFLIQGLHMNLNLPGDGSVITKNCTPQDFTSTIESVSKNVKPPKLVAAWFTLFDVVFVIIMIPFFDRIIYPRLARAGRPMGFVLRVSIGMVIAASAVCVAGVVEHYRLKSVYPDDNSPCCRHTMKQVIGNTPYEAAQMSVFWQIPQYVLIGLSEVFASIAALEFAYQMAPRSVKGVIMGLFYLFTGVGSFIGTATVYMFQGLWFGSYDGGNINCRTPCTESETTPGKYIITQRCDMDYYFFFLAGIEFVGFLLFLLVVRLCNVQSEITAAQQKSTLQTSVKSSTTERLRSPVTLQRQSSSEISTT